MTLAPDGAGKARSLSCPCPPRLAVCTQVRRKETGPWHATPAQTADLQRFVVERALRWIIARKPESWISALRPRVVDAAAFAIEQESWRAWNAMQLDSEAEFDNQGSLRRQTRLSPLQATVQETAAQWDLQQAAVRSTEWVGDFNRLESMTWRW